MSLEISRSNRKLPKIAKTKIVFLNKAYMRLASRLRREIQKRFLWSYFDLQ